MRARWALGSLAVVGALLLGTAAPAAAAGPDHSKVAPFSFTFDAGVVCDFAVEWDITATTDNQLVFPVEVDGDQVVRTTGRSSVIVANLDSCASIQLRGGFRQDLVFHADGSVDINGDGTILAGYFPTDIGGPGMWWFKGHLRDSADSSFTAVAHSFVGNATHLCGALS
jgi:hypothetical protein